MKHCSESALHPDSQLEVTLVVVDAVGWVSNQAVRPSSADRWKINITTITTAARRRRRRRRTTAITAPIILIRVVVVVVVVGVGVLLSVWW